MIVDSAGVVRNNTRRCSHPLLGPPPHTVGAPGGAESIRVSMLASAWSGNRIFPRQVLALSFHTGVHIHPTHPLPKPNNLASALLGHLCLNLGPGETGQCLDKPQGIIAQDALYQGPRITAKVWETRKPTGYLERFLLEGHAHSGGEAERVGI